MATAAPVDPTPAEPGAEVDAARRPPPTPQPPVPDSDRDIDPDDGRRETQNQRLDRNWNEILQELRVTQTGAQIFTGFLLTVAFQPRFASLTTFQRHLYLVILVAAVVTVMLALAPVNLHRGLFRLHAKRVIVRVGHRLLRAALVGVGVVLVGTVVLVFDVVLGRAAAWVSGGVLTAIIVAIGLLPTLVRAKDPAIAIEEARLKHLV